MFAGILLAFVAAFGFNASFVIEKRALHHLPVVHANRGIHMLRTLLTSPLWMCGLAISLAGLGAQVLALSRAPLSVVQPIIASGIVILLMLSRAALHERLGRTEWTGIVLVAIALMVIGLSLEGGASDLGDTPSLGRLGLVAVPTVAAAGLAFRAGGRRLRGSAPLYGLAAGLLYGVAGVATKGVSVLVRDGLISSLPTVLASPQLYVLVAFSAVGLLVLQTGLQRGQASVVVPIANVLSTAYPVAVGMLLFGEELPSTTLRLMLRLAGFAGVMAGTVTLARSRGIQAAYARPDEPIDHELAAARSAV